MKTQQPPKRSAAPQFFGNRHTDGDVSGCIGYLGQCGTGKTYRMQQDIKHSKRVLYIDALSQVGTARGTPLPGYEIHRGGNDVDGAKRLAAFVNRLRSFGPRDSFHLVWQVGRGTVRNEKGKAIANRANYEFEGLCALAFAMRGVTLVLDEVWRFCTAGSMPSALEDIVFTGRHHDVTMLYTAQRAAKVAKDIISQSSQLKVFRMITARDIQSLEGDMPDQAIPQISSLPDRVYIHRNERMEWRIVR